MTGGVKLRDVKLRDRQTEVARQPIEPPAPLGACMPCTAIDDCFAAWGAVPSAAFRFLGFRV